MSYNKKYIFSALLVIVLLLSVGTLVWGSILLINGKSGGGHIKMGAILTFLSTMWLIVANLDKKPKVANLHNTPKSTKKKAKRAKK